MNETVTFFMGLGVGFLFSGALRIAYSKERWQGITTIFGSMVLGAVLFSIIL